MVNVIIGILVIIAVIYIAIISYQHHLGKQTIAMKKENKRLQDLDISNEFKEVESLGLTGDSLDNVKQAHKEYKEINEHVFPKINRTLVNAEKAVRGLNFLKTRDYCDQGLYKLEKTAKKIDEVQGVLDNIKKLNKEHKEAVAKLEKRYQELRKILLTKNAEFGPAIDALEGQLSSIEDTFASFSNLTKNGDQINAEKVLVDLNKATVQLENTIKEVPALYSTNKEQFNKQINEINDAYTKMRSQGYSFANDEFAVSLKELKDAIADNLENIKHLDLKITKDQDDEIEAKINNLYDQMETELKAKNKVDKKINVISKFIDHARNQNEVLANELEKLSHNYSLEHGEIETTNDLGQELANILQVHNQDVAAIKNKSAIYSRISSNIDKFQKKLTEIEQKQMQLNDSIADFSDEELKAHQLLNSLASDLHAIKRRIKDLNLPGISQDYIDYFGLVSDEINHLNSTMNEVKISMDDVNKQLAQIKKDRDTLQDKTKKLVDESTLAEQVMQYANRYVGSDPEIQTALQKAKNLFDVHYDYDSSLNTISDAIEKIEPGAYDRIKNNYFKTKKEN